MTNENITITPTVAAHVLWHYHLGGYEPGSFTRALLNIWALADDANQGKLSAGWPDYALALRLGAPGNGSGVDLLKALSGDHVVEGYQMGEILARVDFNSFQGEGN